MVERCLVARRGGRGQKRALYLVNFWEESSLTEGGWGWQIYGYAMRFPKEDPEEPRTGRP